MKRSSLYLLLLALLTLCGCSSQRPKDLEIAILCSTDMNGQMLPFNYYLDKESDVSLASFCAMRKEQSRLVGEDYCLAFDLGNKNFSGPVNYYYHYIDTITEPLTFRSNRLVGYEAIGFGSRDFKSEEFVRTLRANPELSTSFVCANFVHIDNLEPVFQPYRIIDRNGVIIAVLGLTTPHELAGEDMFHYEIIDMVESAQRWMPEIQSHHPDLVIGLFSCGIEYESFGRDLQSYLNSDGGLPTAILVPGFDFVVLNESRTAKASSVVNIEGKTVPYFVLSNGVERTNIIRVRMHREGDVYQKRILGTSADLSIYQPDPDYCAAVKGAQDSIHEWFNAPIGYLGDTIFGVQGMFGPDAYAGYLNRAMFLDGLADLSITACLIGTDTFPAGPITMKRIFRLYPFENELEYLQLSGEEVLRALEWMASRQYDQIVKNEPPHVLAYLRDPDGMLHNTNDGMPLLEVAPSSYCGMGGINYTIDLTRPEGSRVKVQSLSDGSPFSQDRLYTVAVNSFMVQNGYKFITRGLRWDIEKLIYRNQTGRRESLRSVSARLFAANHGDTLYVGRDVPNWSLIPYDYCQKQIVRELEHPMVTK